MSLLNKIILTLTLLLFAETAFPGQQKNARYIGDLMESTNNPIKDRQAL